MHIFVNMSMHIAYKYVLSILKHILNVYLHILCIIFENIFYSRLMNTNTMALQDTNVDSSVSNIIYICMFILQHIN